MDDRPIAATYSYRHSPFAARSIILPKSPPPPPPLRFHGLRFSPRFIHSVPRAPFMELEHLPPLLPLLNRARPLTGPPWTPKSPSRFQVLRAKRRRGWTGSSHSARDPSGCGQRVRKRMDQDPEGQSGGEFRTGPSGNSPSTGS